MSDIKRRDFLKFIGAGGVGAGVGFYAADKSKTTVEYLVPQVVPPEDYVPGVATWYNTVCTQCDAACGISVRTREGRAKKIEGNSIHPVNQGGLCARGQAGLNTLYNPDRVRSPLMKEGGQFREVSWDSALTELGRRLGSLRIGGQSDKISFLSGRQSGHIEQLLTQFVSILGAKNFLQYSVSTPHAIYKANQLSFGQTSLPHYDLGNADLVVSFGADYLGTWLSPVHYAHAYGKLRQGSDHRGRTVQFESRMSLTGANADEWYAPVPGSEGLLALAMAQVVVAGYQGSDKDDWVRALSRFAPASVAAQVGLDVDVIQRVATAFGQGRGLALAGGAALGGTNAVAVQVATNVLNYLGGAVGRSGGVIFNPDASPPSKSASFQELSAFAQALTSSEVLLMIDANPVYDLPPSSGFAAAIDAVPFVVSMNTFMDESTAMADLVLPLDTYLEAWSDHWPEPGVGFNVASIGQPVVSRVFDTRSLGDVVLNLTLQVGGELPIELPWASTEDYLRDKWQDIYASGQPAGTDFENFWRALLEAGVWGQEPQGQSVRATMSTAALNDLDFGVGDFSGNQQDQPFVFQPYESITLGTGQGANSPWLQETPDPLTSVVYGSWVELNPQTAKDMGVKEGDLVEVTSDTGSLVAPAFLYPALSPGVVAMPMGQGHTEYGRYAKDRGANPISILTSSVDKNSGALAWSSTRVSVTKVGTRGDLIKNDGVTRTLGRQILGPAQDGGH